MKKLFLLFLLFPFNIFTQIAPEWNYTFRLDSNNQQEIKTVLTDNNNNFVFLAFTNKDSNQASGIFLLIGKVTPAGTLQWRRTYSRPGIDSGDGALSMVLDNQNNIYILDQSQGYYTTDDYGVVKYDQNGNFLWDYFYSSPGGTSSYDYPAAISCDNLGNCYVTGTTRAEFTDSILTMKINTNGVLQWIRSFITIQGRLIEGKCLIADNSSNLYVGGRVDDDNNGSLNAVLIKYNSAGVLQWVKTHDGSQSTDDCFLDIKLDNAGNIITSGIVDGDFNFDTASVLLQKYSANGNLLWSQKYHTDNPGEEIGSKILLDNADNIYIMGRTQYYTWRNETSSFILKYNSSGNLIWSNRHGDYYQNPSYAYNISFDLNHDILITGYEKKFGVPNLLLLKYNSINGSKTWRYLYDISGNSTDISYFSGYVSGNLFMAGSTNSKFLMVKMQPTNSYTYTYRRDHLNKPILDSMYTYDTVYLNTDLLPPTAYIRSINVAIDSLLHTAIGDLEITLKNGSIEDTLLYRRGGFLDNMIHSNLNDTSTLNLCVNGIPPFTGYFAPCKTIARHFFLPGNGPWILKIYDRKAPDIGMLKSWALTLTYETPIGIIPLSGEVPEYYSLYQNYPNPFNPVTKIKYSIPFASNTKLLIYDINGKEISELVNEWLNAGTYEIDFNAANLASGIYFYQLITNNFSETKKMVLIK